LADKDGDTINGRNDAPRPQRRETALEFADIVRLIDDAEMRVTIRKRAELLASPQ
jgi:hypothetical protein